MSAVNSARGWPDTVRIGDKVLEARFDVVLDIVTMKKELHGVVNQRVHRGRTRTRLFTCDHAHQTDQDAWDCGKEALSHIALTMPRSDV